MKLEKFDIRAGVRMTWILAASLFFGVGFALIWWPTSQDIAALEAQAKTLYDQADQNEAAVRHAVELRSLAKRVSQDVRLLSGQESRSATLAATVRLLGAEGRVFAVDVRSIVPEPAPSASPVAKQSVSNETLTGVPIEIDVRGRFRDLLHFIGDLPRHDVLIEVESASFADAGDASPKPLLNARIRATMFRYSGSIPKEV
ncbi:MAG TPA: type 4a pilus biogenesis protein PilO [Candidatus Baltobacteraceae bacterium]|nr:type 4a pilus biogenesis protein PilO [Candidatus Baltobacteraceae bacterium]